ncbi:MAG: AAA family ATPase [Bacteroidales bacterium]|nr:AAA family ATPase [Bacteroidales bacterium]
MGKVIAFTNQKGGVGKTTTCINLAAYIAIMGKRVLIIDMDPQGNATSGVGIEKNPSIKTIYNVIDGDCLIKEAILETPIENLDIVPASVDLAGAEIELVQMVAREKILKGFLAQISDNYDYIFIDCPPSLGLLTVNALTASNSIVIPIQCEFFALEGLSQLMNTIRLIKRHLNTELDVEGVILTMKDNRSNLIAEVSNEIVKFFGKKVFDTFIPRNIRLAEAPSHGQPIATYDASSKGADSYLKLAEEFLKRNNDLNFNKVTKNTKINLRRNNKND